MSKKAPSFKLDLAKLKMNNNHNSGSKRQEYSSNRTGSITAGAPLDKQKLVAPVKIKTGESTRDPPNPKQLMSVRKI